MKLEFASFVIVLIEIARKMGKFQRGFFVGIRNYVKRNQDFSKYSQFFRIHNVSNVI